MIEGYCTTLYNTHIPVSTAMGLTILFANGLDIYDYQQRRENIVFYHFQIMITIQIICKVLDLCI